ncbi:hypothetical protein D3C72_1205380 [compost metagenome]
MASAGATCPVADADGAPMPVTAARQPDIAQRLAAALCEVLAAHESRVLAAEAADVNADPALAS